ncbi:DnaB domain-containing protein [Caballeronia hypogeia]|uniref:Replicative DNA helicase n=1 Tax=Caballeronia hypogeia TaxID=1777140 RepID=A0A157ZRY4_9BURK|nr:replicative DNA helicase [Caballeronia hypogeia]SAK48273.1 DnaB domain-containing protein [Caballeronia hypogeia]
MDMQRAVPHAVEAEQSVIGGLLLDGDAIDRIGDLRAEHFFRADHRAIFAQVVELISSGAGADTITVFERLQAQGRAADVGGLAYLNELVQNTPSSANIARYAEIVRDRAQKRGLLSVASEIRDSVGAAPESADVLIDRASAKLEALGEATVKREPKLAAKGLADHINVIDKRSRGAERVISTGLDAIDKQLNGGLRPGWLVILAARPGMGKTALALNVATHVAADHSALFLSMEMPESEIHDRNIASLGRLPLDTVMLAPEDDKEFWNRVTAAAMKVKDLNLHIDDQAALRMLDVRSKARLVKRKAGLDLIVIDYLQLMTGDGANRNAEIEGISRGLKALAKELNVAIIALAQLNRKVEERANRLPMLSDLRDSGSIEQDADAVLFIHREEISNPNCEAQFHGFAQLRVAKFRHGRIGDIPLTYRGEFMRFENHAGAWPTAIVTKTSRKRGFD